MRPVVHPEMNTLTLLAMSALLASSLLPAAAAPLGQFEGETGVGNPKLAGSCQYDETRQEYTIAGAGTNMWFTSDQCHFAWKKMKGDFLLRTRVEFVGRGALPHRKVGWLVRPSLDTSAPYADCAEHGDGLTSLQYRPAAGSNTEQIKLAITNADVLQFERKGNTYIFSAARFGEPFVSAELTNFNLGDDVYAGLFVCSHTGDVVEKVICRDVRIIKPVKQGFTPYRDFIGSSLEVLNPHTGKLQVLRESAEPFEAPNWTHDGAALVYNVSGRKEGWGRLCRFDLAQKTAVNIDTGFANRNNNDHILSFDGTMLAISDQSAGQSSICVVPAAGGTPRRLTTLSPSYAHGWSPDGNLLSTPAAATTSTTFTRFPARAATKSASLIPRG